MIALLVMTDGRLSYLAETVASAERMLGGPITERWMHDDSGSDEHRKLLQKMFPNFRQIGVGSRAGFGRSIARAWGMLSAESKADYVFHLEGDFTFNCPIRLTSMMAVLDNNPHLVQLALRRQPWNPEEEAAGGIIERHPEAYEDCFDGPHAWLEHRLFFTTNPSLYRRELVKNGWPDEERSEGVFTHRLLADPGVRFGFWGRRDTPPWVEHIGYERAGGGY